MVPESGEKRAALYAVRRRWLTQFTTRAALDALLGHAVAIAAMEARD